MVTVTMKICYLCFDIGINKEATYTYETTDGTEYDVCDSCKENVDKAGLESWEIRNAIRERGF